MGKNTESGGSEPHKTSGVLAGAAGKKADLVQMETRISVKFVEKQLDLVYISVAIAELRTLTQEDSRFKTSLATH